VWFGNEAVGHGFGIVFVEVVWSFVPFVHLCRLYIVIL
jgi:hypothetical protein